MEFLSDRALLEEMLERWSIGAHFDSEGLRFQLAKFQKGELLTAPFKPMDYLLLLVRGQVNIYGLREDGSSFSVYLADKSVLLGDIEFVRKAPLPFYTEALDEVLCVALPVSVYREKLEKDARFLNYLLRGIADKFYMFSQTGNAAQPLEEKLVAFLRDIQPDHTLHGINRGVMQLRCSRSQLQKVVRKLCADGVLTKRGKGMYRLG